jgi:TrmH family RNA methyltransferase
MKQITSLQHPLVRYWLMLKEKPAFRRKEKRLLLEGKNAICDVCRHIPAERLIVTDPALAGGIQAKTTLLITDAILKKISSVEENEGVLAEMPLPDTSSPSGTKVMVCDRVQDPGNLGALIRSCLAFGWDACFLLPGCVDPFNDKVVRSSKGAIFSLPLCQISWDALQCYCREKHMQIMVADTEGKKPNSFTKEQKKALVLGNEARGASPPSSCVYEKIAIDMPGPVESLNVAVAGSILLYLL